MQEIIGLYSIEEVLNHVPVLTGRENMYKHFDPRRREYYGYEINVASRRMQTFKQCGLTCFLCGLPATHFLLVVTEARGMGVQAKFILMYERTEFTQDHTYPKSLGGKNHLSNARTLCMPCNKDKGVRLEVDVIFDNIRKAVSGSANKTV